MNKATSNHLNSLYKKSFPFKLTNTFTIQHKYDIYFENPTESFWGEIQKIAEKYIPEATRQEIIAAAKNKRESNIQYYEPSLYSIKKEGIQSEFAKKVWNLAKPEIDAYIDADNKRRMNEYETYRVACEQGIAVPPQ